MRKLNLKSRYDAHSKMSDIRFLEEEIKVWMVSEERKLQILAEMYYAGQHDILQRVRKTLDKDGNMIPNDKLPNNRIVDNQFAIHVDKKANYILGKPLTFSTDNDEYTKRLNKVFGPRAMRTFWTVGHGATLCGLHWVYVYLKDDEMRFAAFPATEILPEWADAEHTELDCAVRFNRKICFQHNDFGMHLRQLAKGKTKALSCCDLFCFCHDYASNALSCALSSSIAILYSSAFGALPCQPT